MGGALEEESAEALAEGRVREEFVENPAGFLKSRDELVEETVEDFARMRYGDLDISPIEMDELEPKYTIGRADGRELDPEAFMERNVDDFLSFWNEEIGTHSNVDLEYAEQVLRRERSGIKEDVRDRFNLQPHSEEKLENSDNPVYDAVVEELVQTLYGQALNKPEGFKDEVEAFERTLKNYDLEPYREIVDNSHSYTVEHLTDQEDMIEAAEGSGSCIAGSEHYFEDYAEDPHSMISEVKKDGETMGYIRNFLMEDENGDEFLAVDTMEIDHKNFERNKDAVRAAGMASIQMMYDLEADYLVGSDSRVRYGVRQAYSNTEKSVTGEKLGDWDIKSYSFMPSGESGKSAYMLMENPG